MAERSVVAFWCVNDAGPMALASLHSSPSPLAARARPSAPRISSLTLPPRPPRSQTCILHHAEAYLRHPRVPPLRPPQGRALREDQEERGHRQVQDPLLQGTCRAPPRPAAAHRARTRCADDAPSEGRLRASAARRAAHRTGTALLCEGGAGCTAPTAARAIAPPAIVGASGRASAPATRRLGDEAALQQPLLLRLLRLRRRARLLLARARERSARRRPDGTRHPRVDARHRRLRPAHRRHHRRSTSMLTIRCPLPRPHSTFTPSP